MIGSPDRTVFPHAGNGLRIPYSASFYTAGSCFAEALSQHLFQHKFNVLNHPFGIVFNPISMARQFELLLGDYTYTLSDLIYHDGMFHSPDHHGQYSNAEPEALLFRIHEELQAARNNISRLNWMVLTLGSSHYYVYRKRQTPVANCHKIPNSEFEKIRASLDHSVTALAQVIQGLLDCNPTLNIIITVSPVRYLKDGFVENSRSKASLLLCCEQLCCRFPQVHYFPAYEIFMDDLRDYRYAADDLVHPSKNAVKYIWSYFERNFFDEKATQLIRKMESLQQLLNHRILHKDSDQVWMMKDKLIQMLEQLKQEYPLLNFESEEHLIKEKFFRD